MGKFKDMVKRNIGKFGQSLIFKAVDQGSYNPSTGGFTNPVETDVPCTAYVTRYKKEDIDGSNILVSDLKLYTSDITQEPQRDWIITIGTTSYKVLSVYSLFEKTDFVFYECQLRA